MMEARERVGRKVGDGEKMGREGEEGRWRMEGGRVQGRIH